MAQLSGIKKLWLQPCLRILKITTQSIQSSICYYQFNVSQSLGWELYIRQIFGSGTGNQLCTVCVLACIDCNASRNGAKNVVATRQAIQEEHQPHHFLCSVLYVGILAPIAVMSEMEEDTSLTIPYPYLFMDLLPINFFNPFPNLLMLSAFKTFCGSTLQKFATFWKEIRVTFSHSV